MFKLTVLFLQYLQDLTLHAHLTLREVVSFIFGLFVTLQCTVRIIPIYHDGRDSHFSQ